MALNDKEILLDKIVDLEYQMFEKLKTPNEDCKREKTFKLMRKSRFYPLSANTLRSYIRDLEVSELHHQNLFVLKYRCMEMGIFGEDELIEEIANMEVQWMNELKRKYPHIVENRIDDFKRYLKCELLTFSEETLNLYYKDIVDMKKQGINMAEESYLYLFKSLGYESLDEVESSRK